MHYTKKGETLDIYRVFQNSRGLASYSWVHRLILEKLVFVIQAMKIPLTHTDTQGRVLSDYAEVQRSRGGCYFLTYILVQWVYHSHVEQLNAIARIRMVRSFHHHMVP